MEFLLPDFSSDAWIGEAAFALLSLWPLWRIFRRAGLPPAQSLVVLVPSIGLVAVIALLVHQRWPALPPLPPRPQPRRPESLATAVGRRRR